MPQPETDLRAERDLKAYLRETSSGAFLVAGVLCAICSVLVAGAAVALKPAQDSNKEVFKQKNALVAAGLASMKASPAEVRGVFEKQVTKELVDIETGEVIDAEKAGIDLKSYDPSAAAKDPKLNKPVVPPTALPGIAKREPYTFVFTIKTEDGKPDGYIFPIYGKGLWSTLYGFLAVEADGKTVRGITYYQHAETPGLGGEVDNPGWKTQWKGKQIYSEGGEVRLSVMKGKASDEYGVDGLSGATITSRGVDNMIKYWLGPEGFGKYLDKHRVKSES